MRRSLCNFEGLESRTLFAAINVNGTDLPDLIDINQLGKTITVTINGVTKNYDATKYNQIVVDGKGGDDSIKATNSVTESMTLHGGDGSDTLYGEGANDQLFGDAGNDVLDGRNGNDVMSGGADTDAADYSDRTVDLTITLDGVANDGAAGASDNVMADIENVFTGSGKDHIVGNASNNVLWGGDNNDTIFGGGGDDQLFGANGDDYLDGGVVNAPGTSDDSGFDTLYGGPGNDALITADLGKSNAYGGEGNDSMWGGMFSDDMHGQGGNDAIVGGAGNDTLAGGVGNDTIWGEEGSDSIRGNGDGWTPAGAVDNDQLAGGVGNDTIQGDGGDDVIWGEDGNDVLQGNDGADLIYGGKGADFLYAGNGDDLLHGGDDNDTLISIGGGQKDKVYGENGADTFWVDSEITEYADADIAEIFMGTLHSVAGFQKLTTSSGGMTQSQNVSRDLNGQDLLDPLDGRSNMVDFSSNPFFASTGPVEADINQGGIGTCYMLAPLSGIAKNNPFRLRQTMVDLGDGTYAVKFMKNGQEQYFRIDADLATTGGGYNYPVFSKTGTENSIWVAIYEKAWTYFHGTGTYKSVDGGPCESLWEAFGTTETSFATAGTPASTWMQNLASAIAGGKTIAVYTPKNLTNASGSEYLVGSHVYLLDHLTYTSGVATGMVVRNPWGFDGSTASGDWNDGFITLTASQAWMNFAGASCANVY